MKKLKLSGFNVEQSEVLTREHLKNVLGGVTSFAGGCYVNCDNGEEPKVTGNCNRETVETACDTSDATGITCSCF